MNKVSFRLVFIARNLLYYSLYMNKQIDRAKAYTLSMLVAQSLSQDDPYPPIGQSRVNERIWNKKLTFPLMLDISHPTQLTSAGRCRSHRPGHSCQKTRYLWRRSDLNSGSHYRESNALPTELLDGPIIVKYAIFMPSYARHLV